MATRKIEIGPTGERVAANVKELRLARRMKLDDLSQRLGELGRLIPKSGLSKIESGERRVDVDDLTALAIALEVNPNRLLLVDHAEVDDELELTEELSATSKSAWAWASGDLTDDAGPWPWAKFAEHGGKPMEALAFQQATRPHDPPIYLTPEEWAVVEPIRQRFSHLWFELSEEERPHFRTVMKSLASRPSGAGCRLHPAG